MRNHLWKAGKEGLRCVWCETHKRDGFFPMFRVKLRGSARITLYKPNGHGYVWTSKRPPCKRRFKK